MDRRSKLARLRELSLCGDAAATVELLSEATRGDDWLWLDLSPEQARLVARTVLDTDGVELSTLRQLHRLLRVHSTAFASLATTVAESMASGAGRLWYRFPRGAVLHVLEASETKAVCGCVVLDGPGGELLRQLPPGAPVCRPCRRKLATLTKELGLCG